MTQKSSSNNGFGYAIQSVTLPCLHQVDFMAKTPKHPLCSLSHSLLKSSFIKYRLFHASVKSLCKGNFILVRLETHLSQLLKCNAILLYEFLEDHKNAVLQKTQM